MTATKAPRRCPRCGSSAIVPIVYGMPSQQLFRRSQRREVLLGGCVLSPDQPSHGCADCDWPNEDLWETDDD